MFFTRMKTLEAMNHLGILSRDSFALWLEQAQIQLYEYEYSNRKYLISGEFYAKADEILINKIKAIHGENWVNYYKHADEVLAFLTEKTTTENVEKTTYVSKAKDVQEFIKTLRK